MCVNMSMQRERMGVWGCRDKEIGVDDDDDDDDDHHLWVPCDSSMGAFWERPFCGSGSGCV